MPGHVGEPQWLWAADQLAQHASSARQRADQAPRWFLDADE
jgi:hypothetical protein